MTDSWLVLQAYRQREANDYLNKKLQKELEDKNGR